MENAQVFNALKETQNALSDIFKHALAKGTTVEGDVFDYIRHSASGIERFVMNAGDEIIALGHTMQIDQLTELFHRMYVMVEHNALLASFWEDMIGEIPDLIEWTENVLAKGGEAVSEAVTTVEEAVVQSAEVIGEAAATTAEAVGEAAIETAEVAGEASLEIADVVAAVATEV